METWSLSLSPSESTCSYCRNSMCESTHLSCGHFICGQCFTGKWTRILSRLEKILTLNPGLLTNKASGITCPFDCPQSLISIPPLWLEKLFESSGDGKSCHLIRFFSTFLAGIPTFFYKCPTCRRTHCHTSPDSECRALSLELIN